MIFGQMIQLLLDFSTPLFSVYGESLHYDSLLFVVPNLFFSLGINNVFDVTEVVSLEGLYFLLVRSRNYDNI